MFDVFQNYVYCIVQNVIYLGTGKTSLDVKRRKESIRQLIHQHLGWGIGVSRSRSMVECCHKDGVNFSSPSPLEKCIYIYMRVNIA